MGRRYKTVLFKVARLSSLIFFLKTSAMNTQVHFNRKHKFSPDRIILKDKKEKKKENIYFP